MQEQLQKQQKILEPKPLIRYSLHFPTPETINMMMYETIKTPQENQISQI